MSGVPVRPSRLVFKRVRSSSRWAPESVEREVPDYKGSKTETLKDEAGRPIGYARVTRPDGEQMIVEQDGSLSQRREAA